MSEFCMPKLGADMDKGKLVTWRKRPGDTVARGEILADVETDKAEVEVESFVDGVLERILVQPGERVPVGTVLAILRKEGEAETEALAPVSSRDSSPAARVLASPAARKKAADLGLDLTRVKGTGPGGRIQMEDLEGNSPTSRPPPESMPEAVVKEDRSLRMRRAIAAAMSRSKREIPHYYLAHTLDLGRATAWLAEANTRLGVEDRLLMGTLLLKATALALKEIPELNGFWMDGAFCPGDGVHLGVAVSLRGGGLMAPAIRHADRLALPELNHALADLVERTRAGGLRGTEVAGGTATVTSLGERGVDTAFGIIVPPQVALVGFGAVVERPWIVEGCIKPRPVVTVTLAADHRASDGHRGGRLLAAIERWLQSPEAL